LNNIENVRIALRLSHKIVVVNDRCFKYPIYIVVNDLHVLKYK